MKSIVKKCLKSVLALSMVFTSLTITNLNTVVDAAEEGYPVSEIAMRTIANAGGDNIVMLDEIPAATEFTYSADVSFPYLDQQQSVALIWGANGGDRNFANIHNRIDWNKPLRVWGYNVDELTHGSIGTPTDLIDVSKPFHMEVSVAKNAEEKYEFKYYINNIGEEAQLVASTILKDN